MGNSKLFSLLFVLLLYGISIASEILIADLEKTFEGWESATGRVPPDTCGELDMLPISLMPISKEYKLKDFYSRTKTLRLSFDYILIDYDKYLHESLTVAAASDRGIIKRDLSKGTRSRLCGSPEVEELLGTYSIDFKLPANQRVIKVMIAIVPGLAGIRNLVISDPNPGLSFVAIVTFTLGAVITVTVIIMIFQRCKRSRRNARRIRQAPVLLSGRPLAPGAQPDNIENSMLFQVGTVYRPMNNNLSPIYQQELQPINNCPAANLEGNAYVQQGIELNYEPYPTDTLRHQSLLRSKTC